MAAVLQPCNKIAHRPHRTQTARLLKGYLERCSPQEIFPLEKEFQTFSEARIDSVTGQVVHLQLRRDWESVGSWIYLHDERLWDEIFAAAERGTSQQGHSLSPDGKRLFVRWCIGWPAVSGARPVADGSAVAYNWSINHHIDMKPFAGSLLSLIACAPTSQEALRLLEVGLADLAEPNVATRHCYGPQLEPHLRVEGRATPMRRVFDPILRIEGRRVPIRRKKRVMGLWAQASALDDGGRYGIAGFE